MIEWLRDAGRLLHLCALVAKVLVQDQWERSLGRVWQC